MTGWSTDPTDQVMLAFSFVSTIQLLLPPTNDNTSLLNIVVYIRDTYDCAKQFNISSILVESDLTQIDGLIGNSRNSTTNAFFQMLNSGNQNAVSQVVTSISQQSNTINNQAIQTALESKSLDMFSIHTFDEYITILDGVPVTTIAISPLGSTTQQTVRSFFFYLSSTYILL
jgi:hypothetical protein